MSAALRVPAGAPRRWLVGPATDLLFGCGLAYAFVFAAHALAGAAFRDWIPFAWLPIATLLVSTPHYGATLIRVYEDAQERRLQARFAVWATAALCLAFWLGLRSVAIGSLFVTLYLTWSPWHYTAQNYGVAMVLLRRRGAAPSRAAARLLRASFVCSFVLAVVSLHGQATPPYYPDSLTGYAYYVRTLGIPPLVRDATLVAGGLVWLGLSAAATTALVRGAELRAAAPALSLMLSQTLWFVAPALARNFSFAQGVEPLGLAQAQYAFLWVALAHAAQYVWITASFAEARQPGYSKVRFYARALSVGSAAWTLPALVFAPGVLGRLPFDAGLGMLIAALVNLHHFMLDGVIWKLRDRRVAAVLVPEANAAPTPEPTAPRRGLARALVGAFGAASLGVSLLGAFEMERGVGAGFARGDIERLEVAEQRLRWIGRASPEVPLRIGMLQLRRGLLTDAERDFDRSLALHPTPAAWVAKGYVAAKNGNFPGALERYDRALALDPRHVEALFQSAYALVELGRRGDAISRLTRAAAVDPANAKVTALLASIRP